MPTKSVLNFKLPVRNVVTVRMFVVAPVKFQVDLEKGISE
jgi:hypothetical protein